MARPAARATRLRRTALAAVLLFSAFTLPLPASAQSRRIEGPARTAAEPQASHPPPAAGRATAQADSQRRQRELQAEQRQLQARLQQLKKQLATAEASHSEATDALRESEAAISNANRRLRELAETRRQVERQIAALQERSRHAALRQSAEELQLAQALRMQWTIGRQSDLQRLFDADDPLRGARDHGYLRYVARARLASIAELRERREELAELEGESRARQAELAAIVAQEKVGRAQLVREQQARRRTLDRLARQIGAQRQSIATLERDEQRLATLVAEINRLLAEHARRDRQRAAVSRSATEGPGATGGRAREDAADTEPAAAGRFAALRGRLTLPVRGEITARFGSPRRTEAGVDAPSWKGVFIRADTGTDVHAVAAGRVVFADWLRGFGNLLVLDHGEGFLSVYGNNESLLVTVGERVEAGAVIASVGNTGGNRESGLYFEMRLDGRPFDPLRWASAR